ncbi:hypothetical protein FRAHR75_250019 [Frankia sp. Hr75.2]|nr:hypothetical protein FRAHR75_250019 [Frankia sp. Hr75.2]
MPSTSESSKLSASRHHQPRKTALPGAGGSHKAVFSWLAIVRRTSEHMLPTFDVSVNDLGCPQVILLGGVVKTRS